MDTKRNSKQWGYAFLTVLITLLTLLISLVSTAVLAQLNQAQNAFFVSRPDTITRVGEPYVYDIIVGGISGVLMKERLLLLVTQAGCRLLIVGI